ncbi:predicted protein [Chaetoceros tenuissimus]|uniref:ShKT domain-containing protein n=1 Tax=Chaetoceros tenuissimus TaxID=426638 RepID=A0AAD3CPR3_9STRA|nr:predicted protein [Chaetoceros tenuissimus]
MHMALRSLSILLVAASSFQLAKASIFCENNPSYSFTFGNQSRDCDWLLSADQATRSNICSTDPAVRQACPFSCSVCCKDNPFYRLYVNNQNVYSCGDIGNNANLQELYCDLSRGPYAKKVKETCPEACGNCPAPIAVVSSNQTSSPTSLPTNAPTMQPSNKSPISTIVESPVAPPVEEESNNYEDDEKQNNDFIINKASTSENDITKKNKNSGKIIYIVVGSVCSFFVLLGLILLRKRGVFSKEDDNHDEENEVVDAENETDTNEASFFDMIINPFDWGSIFHHDSDRDDNSETER